MFSTGLIQRSGSFARANWMDSTLSIEAVVDIAIRDPPLQLDKGI